MEINSELSSATRVNGEPPSIAWVAAAEQIASATGTLATLAEELQKTGLRRLVDAVSHLSSTITALRVRQEERSVHTAVMAFAAVAHDVDDLVLAPNSVVSDIGKVLQEKLERAFAESGVLRFQPQEGMPYDKDRHKAIDSLKPLEPLQDRSVAQVHRRGYEHGGQVLSPALVTIYRTEE